MASAGRRERLNAFCAVDKVNNAISIEWYIRKGIQMLTEVRFYLVEDAFDDAYVRLRKVATLFLDTIPSHASYGSKYKGVCIKKGSESLEFLKSVVASMDEQDAKVKAAHCDDDLTRRFKALKAKTKSKDAAVKVLPSSVNSRQNTLASLNALKLPESKDSIQYPSVNAIKPSWISNTTTSTSVVRDTSRLRKVVIPKDIIAKFVSISSTNTSNNIETCALLTGKLSQTSLVITTLVVPSQVGGSDTCSMTDEASVFEHCINNDLLTLGWIHSHPTQSCFLSSVDLHTSAGFQSILPEAIAIVYAPCDRDSNKRVGVFRLTAPNGLTLIQNCKLNGFHPHESNFPIYETHSSVEWGNNECFIDDLRKKS